MTKRERLEDLGVLLEKISSLMDHDLFEICDKAGCRTKDFDEHFRTLSEDKQSDLLHEIAYGIEDVSNKLADCWAIAKGEEE